MIRMGADPRCNRAAAGKRFTNDLVLRSADGGLANVFVNLQGSFPAASVPGAPVLIDQQDCLFVPRVVGARVGQTLQITNSDPTGHNVHSLSTRGNAFNISQPVKGITSRFQLKADEVVLRIRCDIHSWMVSYVGVLPHSYFAVSAVDGGFRISGVPAGRRTIQVWHERYGRLARTVEVTAGQTTTVDFEYSGKEQPAAASVQEMIVPAGAQTIQLAARH
jgi:plastocyanin